MALTVTSKGTATGQNSATKSSLTIASGSTVVCCAVVFKTAGSPTATYNDGATPYSMTKIVALSYGPGSDYGVALFYLDNVAAAGGSGSVTCNNDFSGSNDITSVAIYELTGTNTSGSLDKSAISTGRSTTPSSGSTATTSQNDEVVIGVIGNAQTNGTWDGTVSENVQTASSSTFNVIQAATKILTSTQTCVCSKTGVTKDYWAAAVATFKAAANGGPTPVVKDMIGMGIIPFKR